MGGKNEEVGRGKYGKVQIKKNSRGNDCYFYFCEREVRGQFSTGDSI